MIVRPLVILINAVTGLRGLYSGSYIESSSSKGRNDESLIDPLEVSLLVSIIFTFLGQGSTRGKSQYIYFGEARNSTPFPLLAS
jgi:hypothetical protein